MRLAAHIFARHDGEDHRYAAMRHKFGARWWWWSLVQVFLLQAILMWFIAAPLVAVMLSSRAPMGVLDYLGVGIAAAGFLFEALADVQLARFRLDPRNKGKVMDRGLWRWSRHPNYFGESVMWWGFFDWVAVVSWKALLLVAFLSLIRRAPRLRGPVLG